MKATKNQAPPADPKEQLEGFIAKFGSEDRARIRSVRRAMRQRLGT